VQALETVDIAALTSTQVAALSSTQLNVLTSNQVPVIETADIAALATAQVAALSSAQLNRLTSNQVQVIETADIAALTTAQIASLATTQIAGLTTAQVAALSSTQLNALTSSQMQAIETTDIAALTTSQVATLSVTQLNTLTSSQVRAIDTADIVALTASQVAALSVTQMNTMASSQVQAIETTDIAVLTTTQVAALSSMQLNALISSQVQAIETADIIVLTTSQVATLGTTQVLALTTEQYAVLRTADISVLTTMVIAGLTTSQLGALTTTQLTVLASPIILDLSGDGVSTLSYSAGTRFDLHASGRVVQTGWVAPTDGLLALDRNHDGKINDGSELFGTSTVLAGGDKAPDGYAALRELDSDGDHLIKDSDAHWNDLKVWVDKNSDGISQERELFTPASLNIVKLDLDAQATSIDDNGNMIGLMSSYETGDSNSRDMADVWFVADANSAAVPRDSEMPDLRARVSSLAQAIASFDASQFGTASTAAGSAASSLINSQWLPGQQAVAINVGGMVAVLKQFDAGGNLLANPLSAASPSQRGVNEGSTMTNELKDPAKTGFLAN
jgi:hypothetical protein